MNAMKLHNSLLRNCLTLSFLVGGMMVFATPAKAQLQSTLNNKSFEVNVTDVSDGSQFPLCFNFSTDNILSIDDVGEGPFGPRFSENKTNQQWQSVIARNQNFTLGISGLATRRGLRSSTISGDIIADDGSVYTFAGRSVNGCSAFTIDDSSNFQ